MNRFALNQLIILFFIGAFGANNLSRGIEKNTEIDSVIVPAKKKYLLIGVLSLSLVLSGYKAFIFLKRHYRRIAASIKAHWINNTKKVRMPKTPGLLIDQFMEESVTTLVPSLLVGCAIYLLVCLH